MARTGAGQIDSDDEFDHHASWLDDDDDSSNEEGGYASDDATSAEETPREVADEDGDNADNDEEASGDEEQEAVIPWRPDDPASHGDSSSEGDDVEPPQRHANTIESTGRREREQSEADEDDEAVGDFSDDWADEYLAMDAGASTAATRSAEATSEPVDTAAGATEAKTSDRAEPNKHGLARLFPGYEASINSLRCEINLVEKATERAAAAAMATSLPVATTASSTTTDSEHNALASTTTTISRAQAEEPSPLEVRVHPLSLAIGTESEHSSKAPLSPKSIKRANSVYVTPTSTSKALMKRQDSLTMPASVSRSQILWNSESNRRSSRMLDEWKRKEIWHDFKRAEENVSGPQAKKLDVVSEKAGSAAVVVSEARLESLLQSLRAEINSSSSVASSRAAETPFSQLSVTTTNGDGKRYSTIEALGTAAAPAVVFEPHSQDRRQTIGSAVPSEASIYSVPGCSRSEYEEILQEKRFLVDELENRAHVSVTDKEIIRSMSERVQLLENSDRENQYLKDAIHKHVIHELSSKERLKTLGDQLALTSKSEEQLKLQTQQLFQQNQSLQSDLLEKIAAEASKIQKMAHLSAEKESLMQELERKDSVSSKRQLQEKEQLQQKTIRRLLRVKKLANLRAAIGKWQMSSQRLSNARCHALHSLSKMHRIVEMKAMAKAYNRLKVSDAYGKQQLVVSSLQTSLAETRRSGKVLAIQNGLLQLNLVLERWRARQLREAFRVLQLQQEKQRRLANSLELGYTKLGVIALARLRSRKQHAFDRWKARAQLDGIRVNYQKAMQSEKDLNEAKDCVFSLSREKTKVEEKLQKSREDYKRLTDQLTENNAELQVVKHAFVATVIRDVERGWLRAVFIEWRVQANVSLATKGLRLQSEMAELKAAERDKYAKTVDDYNRVLRSDLERFQFFSQDKRIAVDVLTKKLLREEEKYKQMEEHQVTLEEKAHSLRSQLSAFLEWEGLELPLPMLSLSKDIAINNLKELFLLHATVNPNPNNSSQHGGSQTSLALLNHARSNGMDGNAAPRLSIESLLRMIEYSTLLENNQLKKEELEGKIMGHLPDYAVGRGLLFPDFLVGVNNLLQDLFHESSNKSEQMRAFWGSLLALVDPSRWNGGGGGSSGNEREHVLSGRSPWAGRLSDDILQNQEKLLAVLEHETAVVERAVMEKSSLKHTYPSSDHASITTTFYEYQCDPMLPPEPANGNSSPQPSSPSSPGYAVSSPLAVPAEIYINWYQTAQVRDLFLSFHQPLLKVLMKYSNEKRMLSHGNQFCLQLSGILKMLEDMKLYPSYLSKEVIHHVFGSLCDRDGLLTPQSFTLFLGSCALELYTKSLAGNAKPPAFPLSAREILLSFFCDLGFLAESEAPAPSRICFVGMEIESILWSLYEYYATTDDHHAAPRAEDERVSMTAAKFINFITEIAGGAAGADDMYRRVMNESRRAADSTQSGSSPQMQWTMYFDEFYSAISYIQEARNKQITYPNPGEAVRHWMQQTQ